MVEEIFPMTQAGFDQLKDELEELESKKRTKAKQRIQHARSFCDFKEDSEYEAALKALATIEERIATIQYVLQQAHIVEANNTSIVEIGSTVSIMEMPQAEIETYTIVGMEEANPIEGNISYHSPIAKSLLGATVNDIVTVATPDGDKQMKISSIL